MVQYERVLVYAELLSTEDHADLEEALAECLSTRDLWAEARDHWERAIDLRRGLADSVSLARCLRRYSVCLWRLCCAEEAVAASTEAFELVHDAIGQPGESAGVVHAANSEAGSVAEARSLFDECLRIG